MEVTKSFCFSIQELLKIHHEQSIDIDLQIELKQDTTNNMQSPSKYDLKLVGQWFYQSYKTCYNFNQECRIIII